MQKRTYEGDVAVVSNSHMEDWFTIEKAVHEGRSWWVSESPTLRTFQHSGRLSDADVEGTLVHMQGIAQAIRDQSTYHAKRCAADATGERVLLWSPRNSEMQGSITHKAAESLAAAIVERGKETKDV